MKWSIRIGSLFGIPIKVHLTFLLLLLFIGVAGTREGGIGGLNGVIFVILIFACVLIHELGHSIVAKRYGIEVRDITLLPIGGVSHIEEIPQDPRQELIIALVGPLTSFALALVFLILGQAMGQTLERGRLTFDREHVLMSLFALNLILGSFNLIPAFPMDGGRILRGFLANRMSLIRATRVAAGIGQTAAIVMFFVGIFYNWWLALIAIFIYIGAEGEERSTEMRVALSEVPARRAMLTDVEPVHPDQTLKEMLEKICHLTQDDFPVIDQGKLIGLITKTDILSALKERDEDAPVKDFMRKEFAVAEIDTPLSELFDVMNRKNIPAIPVMHGMNLVGLITLEQIGRYHMFCNMSWKK
jgi:Zn-dependent protease